MQSAEIPGDKRTMHFRYPSLRAMTSYLIVFLVYHPNNEDDVEESKSQQSLGIKLRALGSFPETITPFHFPLFSP